MKHLVNRSDRKSYNKIRQDEMTDLDLVAADLLAVNYSRRTSPTKASQMLIQNDCVAVCVVDGFYWIASNTQCITQEDLQQFAQFLEQEEITCYIVTNGQGHMHAEMQLLCELLEEDPTRKNVRGSLSEYSFGVSKPCCRYCKDQLDFYGITYTHWHDSPVTHWEHPCS